MQINSINFAVIVIATSALASHAADEFSIHDLLRKKRYLVFPDPLDSETKVQVLFGLGLPMEGVISMTLGYVLKCNYDLPYNASVFTDPYVRYERSVDDDSLVIPEEQSRVEEQKAKDTTSRWSIYNMLEMAMGTFDVGRACLLRAICESAQTPFNEDHGLLGELLHVLLTPSTTKEEHEMYTDQEYQAAEKLGSTSGSNCRSLFSECENSPLDYFTKLMHQA